MPHSSAVVRFGSLPYDLGMALEYLDTSGNRRLAMFTKMLALTAQSSEDPREVYRSLVTLMRRAFELRCYAEVSTEGLKPGFYRLTRLWREDGTEGVPDRTPWLTEGVPVRHGGLIAEVIARSEPAAVRHLEWSKDDPAYKELGMYRSLAVAPGGMGEWHNWVIVFDESSDAFTAEDVEVLVLRVNLVGLSLKNLSILAELRGTQSQVDKEVDRIAAIQRSLLPAPRPDVPGLDVAAKFETFDRAGGDLYDYTALPDGSWGFLIADASGHGPSAAVVSAMLNAILHTFGAEHVADGPSSLVDVLNCGNSQMVARCIEQSFVTAFLCTWNPKKRTLSYARAGHPPALLRRAGRTIPLDKVGDLPLGIFADTVYEQAVEPMKPGDVIVLFTDGLVEAVNTAGEMFGDERLAEAMIRGGDSAQSVLDAIWGAVVEHQQGGTPRDDQTLLVLRVKD